MIQLSVMRITGYGPWTLTLGPDREHELQMLQSSLYSEIQAIMSGRGALAFQNRCDECVVLSSGITLPEHVEAQERLCAKFPEARLQVSVGCGKTAYEANSDAHRSMEAKKYLDEPHQILGSMAPDSEAVIMHMDIEGSSGGSMTPYDVTLRVFGLYHRMASFFAQRGSLAFFMGGDNFMIATQGDPSADAREFVGLEREGGVPINCGIGRAAKAREAAARATGSLDAIRKMRDAGGAPTVYEMPC